MAVGLDRVLGWASHPRAPWLLGVVSFAESSFFLVPPDVMLIPMALARPQRALHLAAWTTLTSVVGGLAGYAIGALALESIRPWLLDLGHAEAFEQARAWFTAHGFIAILVAGFSPIPYKVFCLAAGSMGMSIPLFVIASFIGRGSRFFLFAALMAWGGPHAQAAVSRFGKGAVWGLTAVALAIYLAIRAS
jgi:membrane protein YqaA with SNARE-associated domain